MADAVQIKLVLENEQLTKQLKDTERKFARLEAQAKKSTEGVSNSFMTLGRSLAPVAAAATAGIAALAALGATAVSTSKQFADLSDQAMTLDIDFTTFQALEYAAVQAGTSIEKVTSILAKAQIELGQALESGDKENAFSKLGLDIAELEKLDPAQFLTEVAKAINAIDDPSRRAAASMSIFGKGAREANLFLTDLANEGLQETIDAAKRAGVVIDELSLKNMKQLDDSVEALNLQWRALKAEALAPTVSYLNEMLGVALDNTYTKTERLGLLLAKTISDTQVNLSAFGLLGQGLEKLLGTVKAAPEKAAAKIDWSNFNPPAQKAFEAKATSPTKTNFPAAASAGKAAAKVAEETFVENWSGISKLMAEAGTDEDRRVFDYWEDRGRIIRAGLEAGLRADDPVVQELLTNLDNSFNSVAEKALAAGEAAAPAMQKIRDDMKQSDDIMKAFAQSAEDAFISVVNGSMEAVDAIKALIAQILIAIAQAALLSAINGGSFMSNLGGIVGGKSAGPQAGPQIRIYNQGGGVVQTRRRSNGDTDLIIGQLATAISKGGNQLDKAMRRTYGIGRQGV